MSRCTECGDLMVESEARFSYACASCRAEAKRAYDVRRYTWMGLPDFRLRPAVSISRRLAEAARIMPMR